LAAAQLVPLAVALAALCQPEAVEWVLALEEAHRSRWLAAAVFQVLGAAR